MRIKSKTNSINIYTHIEREDNDGKKNLCKILALCEREKEYRSWGQEAEVCKGEWPMVKRRINTKE